MFIIYAAAIGIGTGLFYPEQPQSMGLSLILVSFALLLYNIAENLKK